MKRYWVPKECLTESEAVLAGDIFHHIVEVCRHREGSHFEVLNSGKAYLVELNHIGKKQAIALIKEERNIQDIKKPWIRLCVGMSRYSKMDEIVEKAVELGVKSFHPFFSDNSYIRTTEKFSPSKWKRWEKIVVGATQQTGRGELMELCAPEKLPSLLEKINPNEGRKGLFLYEGSVETSIHSALSNIRESSPIEELWVIIGSEGGFSSAEVEMVSSQGIKPVGLGSQILRVETACLAMVSILKYEFEQFDQ